MSDSPISPHDFGASFRTFMEQMARAGTGDEPFFRRRLREHFGDDPSKLTIVAEKFTDVEHANLHLAVESFATAEGRWHELLGISSEGSQFLGVGLAQLVAGASRHGAPPAQGPVAYINVALGGDGVLACTHLGLYLVGEGEARLAILVSRTEHGFQGIKVEVLACQRATADRCLAELRRLMRKRNVYRGHVVSLAINETRQLQITFHHLPQIDRDQIILPSGVLERIERESVGFSKHAAALRAAGRHLKRGMLLHGPPGTGKTLTAMYLASRMPDRTVLLITGRSMGLLEQACAMARVLQPATIILEDVDLIAEERTRQGNGGGCAPILFELLNQMDGLADDADILFVLTTNRPDILEPALAARPGRIDQAVEVPLPDADCRRRLFELYGRGLKVAAPIDPYIERTAGASASFIRELLRKSALFAADEGGDLEVRAKHIDAALHEMVVEGGDLMKSLLGAAISLQ